MSTAPLPPNATLADIYAAIVPGQTIAEAVMVRRPGDEVVARPAKFLILAVEHMGDDWIRCFGTSQYHVADIGRDLAPPILHLVGPDGAVFWSRT